jgi:hypothetical protein
MPIVWLLHDETFFRAMRDVLMEIMLENVRK